MKAVTKYESNDGKIFDTEKEALEHEEITDKINNIIQLLGGTSKEIDPDSCSFSNGEGYVVINSHDYAFALELTKLLMRELGIVSGYQVTSRICYEHKYLGKIASIFTCIIDGNNQKIRVGQAYYASNPSKLGTKIYNKETK